MISIVTVNYNSYDFLDLMMESLELYTHVPFELIVVDNSSNKKQIHNREYMRQFFMKNNIGHGEGLNWGLSMIKYMPYVLVLDIDCHLLTHNWHEPFIKLMNDYDIVMGKGVQVKPIRPCCMFMKREIAHDYDWRPTPGYKGHRVTPDGFDVGIQAYHKMVEDDLKIKLINPQYNRYETHNGEEWCIGDEALVYHHWHGSHLKERQKDFQLVDLQEDKLKLFSSIPWRMI